MSLDVDDQKAATSRRPPRRWTWIAVVAGVVVVAVVLAIVLSQRGGSDRSGPANTGVHPGLAPDLVLHVPSASGRCMVPSAGLLAQRPIAFEGRVSGLSADSATLTVTHRFAGDVGDTVLVHRPPTTTEVGLSFVRGGTYLLAAEDGTVAVCGLSGQKTPALARMYAAAFPG